MDDSDVFINIAGPRSLQPPTVGPPARETASGQRLARKTKHSGHERKGTTVSNASAGKLGRKTSSKRVRGQAVKSAKGTATSAFPAASKEPVSLKKSASGPRTPPAAKPQRTPKPPEATRAGRAAARAASRAAAAGAAEREKSTVIAQRKRRHSAAMEPIVTASAAVGTTGNPASVSKPAKQAKVSKKKSGGRSAGDADFKRLVLHEALQRQLEYLKFLRATPVQALAVPAALDGQHDVMVRAPTGSGKTLAFLLPVLHQLLLLPAESRGRNAGTLALVISPTKELALQTLKVAQDLMRMVPATVCGAVAGGEKPKSEKARLRKGLNVLCATPGRLLYHLEQTGSFVSTGLRCMVLDEADRLLDMGFEPQIRLVYKKIREAQSLAKEAAEIAGLSRPPAPPLQTLLISATLSPAVRRLAGFCLRPNAFWADPDSSATEGDADTLGFVVPKTLTQWYCVVPCKERLVALIAAIVSRTAVKTASVEGRKTGRRRDEQEQNGAEAAAKAIVFFSSGASVDFHHDVFLDAAWPSLSGLKREKAERRPRNMGNGFIGFNDDRTGMQEDEEEEPDDDDEDKEEEQPTGENAEMSTGKIFASTPLFKLHGNLDKDERAGYIRDFSKASGGVLLASDAASRGLDFPRIDWIIQYDPPQRIEEYLHRIGRTARIGRSGDALIFLQPSEIGFLDALRDHGVSNLKELNSRSLPAALLRCGAPAELLRARDFGQLLSADLASRVERTLPLLRLARTAFLSALRSYRAFPRELRTAFPFEKLHTGHFAASFALRETPEAAVRMQRRAGGGAAKGGGKGRKRGHGADEEQPSEAVGRSARRGAMRKVNPADEFAN